MIIDFEKYVDKLAPCIVQDVETNRVLMLGYMNADAFEKTKAEKKVTFFSRSRQSLWTKGETSGHFLHVKQILVDCDSDAILIKATPDGAICHTGADTCFNEVNENDDFLFELEKAIWKRKLEFSETSYTSKLFAKGINKIAQKVGEEAVESVIAALAEDDSHFKNEVSDLLYHLLVLLAVRDTKLSEVLDVLRSRRK
ncbi:MAG: bifunctional phosphoribosyl-AMP cyclohydrolase/phosphoribosyl-ATP diphosphatase HisIE [Pyrinomonadaceae bacterium]|nr:bifunctional phosphoribosyl-AMP cyclohydrolase/phosphoribosyl-ATP diphosphatase HisIE [Pyrinomonadaceae bacterium]